MLYFVGTGISGYDTIPTKAIQVIADADVVYLEEFTSPISAADVARIKGHVTGQLRAAKRWLVEDGREILECAKTQNTVLLSYGDPYIATTHIELRTRAANEKIKTVSIHGSSSITSMIGECGLHYYKVGRTATIMDDAKSITTPYYTIYNNMIQDNHTILLLEYSQDGDFFLDPVRALEYLKDAEEGQKRGVISPDTFALVASRIGLDDQRIISGRISGLLNTDFGKPPHTVIIPATMHFTEADAVKALTCCLDDPAESLQVTEKISAQMIKKYVPLVREALEEVRPLCQDPKFASVLENTELYVRDAEQFLLDGKDEVAILCIGYADGLVDSLRMVLGMDPKM